MMTRLRILQVSTVDAAGGAEQVAMNLHRGFRAAGDEATLAVGYQRTSEPGVVLMRNASARGFPGKVETIAEAIAAHVPVPAANVLRRAPLLAQPGRLMSILRGREDFEMPATTRLLESAPSAPDVLHCHNLHGGYFDLRQLPRLSARVPTFLTLHDMWMLTGHCAYSLGCERWRIGCGECPDLTIHPAIRRDATRENLLVKKQIYRSSRLYVASPSRWLLDMARASVLSEGVAEWRLIPYGVDLDVFDPRGRAEARARLGLPPDALVLLYAANWGKQNPFKDYSTAVTAVASISERMPDRDLVFLVLGGVTAGTSGRTRFVPFVRDRAVLADYYRASDLFLHAAREDNFPNTVLEAQACGTPVIATAVGGIPEQIADRNTGVLVPPRGASEMADAAMTLLRDRSRLAAMRRGAADRARQLFDFKRHVNDYRSWFSEVVSARRS